MLRRRIFGSEKNKIETNNSGNISSKFLNNSFRSTENDTTFCNKNDENEICKNSLNVEENEHDKLSNELLRLTSSMKHNFSIAGNVIREDNQTLNSMQTLSELNRNQLEREGKRLEHHAYKSCFECTMLLTVILVVWSFIAMIIVMKIFPKKI